MTPGPLGEAAKAADPRSSQIDPPPARPVAQRLQLVERELV
jgi:hypothetical protein